MVRCCFTVAVAIGMMLAAPPAGANDKAESKKHFKAGLALMKSEDFEGAARELERSVELMPRASNLMNLATCYQALGRKVEALELFERLRDELDADLKKDARKEVNAKIEELSAATARLELSVTPDRADVKLDGVSIEPSRLSKPMRLMPGTHDIEVSLEGFEPKEKSVELVPGSEETVELRLMPVLAKQDTDQFPAQTDSTATAPEPTDKKHFPLFVVGLAGTIVSAGVSAGMWGAAVAKRNEHNEKNDQLDPDPDNYSDQIAAQRDAAQEDAETYNKVAVAMTAVTGAFVVLTVTSALLRARHKKESESTVSLAPGRMEVRF